LGGGVRLALAQYRELAAFAQFASDLDETTRKQLEHGQRITELMKQKQYSPLTVAEMALVIYLGNEGHLNDVELKKITAFEAAFLQFVNSQYADLLKEVNATFDWNPSIEAKFKEAIQKFKTTQSW